MSQARRHQQAMRLSDAGSQENHQAIVASEVCAEDVKRVPAEKKSNWAAKIARGRKSYFYRAPTSSRGQS